MRPGNHHTGFIMEPKTQFFSTPIYYVNAKPHLGHAYTTIATDVATRFKQMDGYDTYFLTGTDEHGDKIVQAAEKQSQSPAQYVEKISRLFQDLWPRLHIENDQFIRTTQSGHIQVVEHLLSKIHARGDIYFSSYEGLYCYGCERFYQERELVDGKCPDHGTAPSSIKESNYFFKMSQYQDWLIDHIKTHPGFIHPKQYETEILSFLKEPLEDLCISRPKSRLTWGITLPFDDNYVTYVWFDALTNYISALGYPDGPLFKKFWPSARHFVAKDIIKPHGIYWPIMLKAAGPRHLQRAECPWLLECIGQQNVQIHWQCHRSGSGHRPVRRGRVPVFSDAGDGVRPGCQFYRGCTGIPNQRGSGQ